MLTPFYHEMEALNKEIDQNTQGQKSRKAGMRNNVKTTKTYLPNNYIIIAEFLT